MQHCSTNQKPITEKLGPNVATDILGKIELLIWGCAPMCPASTDKILDLYL